jgi:hypothetical protein
MLPCLSFFAFFDANRFTKWLMSFNPDKADIMVFSNTDVGYNFIFSLNGNDIPITMNHKHLGVTHFVNQVFSSVHTSHDL